MDEEAARQLLSKYDDSTKLFSLAGTQCWCRLVETHSLESDSFGIDIETVGLLS